MTIEAFLTVFEMVRPYAAKMVYWHGPAKAAKLSKKVRISKFARNRKLSLKDEFLLTLIRLRQGILNEDLADRFGICTTSCSNIFNSWIRLLAMLLGRSLVKWIPKEAVMEHMPEMFKKKGYGNVRCIIDCSEVFIQRSKSLYVQAVTWSDYKHHNTLKFLIGISPAGYITYLSYIGLKFTSCIWQV